MIYWTYSHSTARVKGRSEPRLHQWEKRHQVLKGKGKRHEYQAEDASTYEALHQTNALARIVEMTNEKAVAAMVNSVERELGVHYRPVEETLRDTVNWFRMNGYT